MIDTNRFYVDCEFDGHGGELLSISLVREDGWSTHIQVTGVEAKDPWVIENVLSIMDKHSAQVSATAKPNYVGHLIRNFVGDITDVVFVADSPVDIARLCAALSTSATGEWEPSGFPRMTFEVHNVDCWPNDLPGAVQHNAFWDAAALRLRLTGRGFSFEGPMPPEEVERLHDTALNNPCAAIDIPDPRAEGRAARESGKRLFDNPYQKWTGAHRVWREGWLS